MDTSITEAELNEDNLHRLTNFILERHDYKISPADAKEKLKGYKLTLKCGPEIAQTQALQAALLTALNAGKRSFLGGVEVIMPANVPALIHWPDKQTLSEIVLSLGGVLVDGKSNDTSFTLLFGEICDDKNHLYVICNGWVGGVSESELSNRPVLTPDFALGGVLAGALGVAGAFFRVTGLKSLYGTEPVGLSLFKPKYNWLAPEAIGPGLSYFPQKLWILGLGHLGQACLWSLGLLSNPAMAEKVRIVLQDYDVIKEANFSTGMLSEKSLVGEYKTRVCSQWLEERGIVTNIVEQRFHANTRIDKGRDPCIAICGFDKAEPRRFLEDAGFDFIVECALGAAISNFDKFILHTFPQDDLKAKEIWSNTSYLIRSVDPRLQEIYLRETKEQECGVLASGLAGKAIATSFVGTIAGAFIMAELLKGLHGGGRCGVLNAQVRSLPDIDAALLSSCQNKLVPNGFIEL